jgi:hypothetical protein
MIDVVFAMMLPCDTMTPRGVPVEPDVNISAARSPSPIGGTVTVSAELSPRTSRVPDPRVPSVIT